MLPLQTGYIMDERDELGSDNILIQCEKITASATFGRSQRARELLSYLVRETVEDRQDELKAFTIAQDVFQRDESFDPETDTLVRVQAGRLRSLLAKYYRDEGANDPIRIAVPKGGYVPVFELASRPKEKDWLNKVPILGSGNWSAQTAAISLVGLVIVGVGLGLVLRMSQPPSYSSPEATPRAQLVKLASLPLGPKIAVLPVTRLAPSTGKDQISRGLTYRLANDLTRFQHLFVLTTQNAISPSAPPPDMAALAQTTKADYFLAATVTRSAGQLHVSAQLITVKDLRIIWSKDYDRTFANSELDRVFADVSAEVASTVGSPYGAVDTYEPQRIRGTPSEEAAAYRCMLRFYDYAAQKSSQSHLKQRRCLEDVTHTMPNNARAWAMLSWIYGDELRFGYNRRTDGDPAKRSLDAAKRAHDLASNDAFTHQYIAEALFLNGDDDLAMAHLERAIVLNPNDAEVLASAGWQYAYRGDWELAEKFAEKAKILTPGHANWYRVVPYMVHFRRGDYQKALAEVETRHAPHSPLSELGRAAARTRLGDMEKAKALFAELERKYPGYAGNIEKEFKQRRLPADFAKLIDETFAILKQSKLSKKHGSN